MDSVIFDLDNTLYPEESYVKSGFNVVANYLSGKYDYNQEYLFNLMMNIFNKEGRGKVFNHLIDELGLSEDVFNLVYLYRFHIPDISLYKESIEVLTRLKKDFKLGLITDGRSFVQKRKIDILDIDKYFDVIMFTDILGEKFWKPSVKPYELVLNYLDSKPINSCYVGDDPYKDFKAPKELGMMTIQVKIEKELDYWKKRGHDRVDADVCVDTLDEVVKYLGEF